MKKKVILTTVLLIIMTICIGYINPVLADPPSAGPGKIDPDVYEPGALTLDGSAANMGRIMVRIARTIGIIVALVGLMVIGIKYMAGSVEQRAEYKKSMIPYVVGCVMIFAITILLPMLVDIVDDVF